MRHLGVRARLLLAFLAISGFSALAAASAIYAFRQVGARIEMVETQVAPALTSLEVSRSAERIIAAAPALLAAADTARRDQVASELRAELARLKEKLLELKRGDAEAALLTTIEQSVAWLSANLAGLEDLVARRLVAGDGIARQRRRVHETQDETQRLLAPWQMVIEGQIARQADAIRHAGSPAAMEEAARHLAASIAAQQPALAAQRQFSAIVDMLAEASTTDQERRLQVLAFQLGRALREVGATATGLDPRLQPLFRAQVAKLREMSEGADAIPAARRRELALVREGAALLTENAGLSAGLTEAVDRLAAAAKADIAGATRDALAVQRRGTQVLIALVLLSLATSVLIVWLYVGRNIVRRLTALGDGMVAIAAGRLGAPVAAEGSDEIAAMGRAVEVFRRNAIELDRLLEERSQAAAQLEQQVRERTAELERRRAVLRVTFDNMGHGVAMFDAEHRMAAWNQRFQELLDLHDDQVGLAVTYPDFVRGMAERGEYGAADADAEVRRRVASLDRPFLDERTRPDGTVLEIRRNPVPGGGFVLIYADITERKRAEREMAAARDAAAAASRTMEAAYRELKAAQASLVHAEKMASLGQLTAGIAHELKNPLNFINNFAALAQELLVELQQEIAPALAADRAEEANDIVATLSGNLGKIIEHGRRADGIIRSMLLHSRGGSGERQKTDVNALVQEALNLAYHGARSQNPEMNVTLERDFGKDIAPLEMVPQDVTRVLLNLFGNALYATAKRRREERDQGWRPTLTAVTRDHGDAVEIRVRDNGTGMPPEVRAKLFTPFFTTKPTGEGTGLGLSISYDIVVQQHGGSVEVESEPGAFTEFTIRLPRALPRTAAAAAERADGGPA
ncbi:PAS-domain containing protein [Roseomonas sp. AR75]|uniref:PAS-domain containing protein n=1 Tax=Roseomonas sp. AR75 TaxID=2562311 RepID=UPI0010BFCADC|nr:PAS-domain containing protein [Roseomonas sp. AR75]